MDDPKDTTKDSQTARVPTRVEIVAVANTDGDLLQETKPPAADPNHMSFHISNPKMAPPFRLNSDDNDHVVVRLDTTEVALFQVFVDAAKAFAMGQITLPPPSDGKDALTNKGGDDMEIEADPINAATLVVANGKGQRVTLQGINLATETAETLKERILQQQPTSDSGSDAWNHITATNFVHKGVPLSSSTEPLSNFCQHDSILIVPPEQPPTVRVAGGWVRDKLLGLAGHDIDVAVDTLTGLQFAQLIVEYAEFSGKHSQIFPNSTHSGRIGVIAANPAQSKHLETATLRLCGVDVDISNLRGKEEYDENSRIPTVRFGTPLQDAERRDFTMNALFFELVSQSIEDWTGRGLQDLKQGVLVTPLEPVQTFQDDPLRVLRAIRFAVRYQFQLSPDLSAAAQLPQIHQALHRKVSRERVGKELEGMLSSSKPRQRARPLDALNTVARLQLAGSVFCFPQVGQDRVTGLLGHVLGEPYQNHWDMDDPAGRAVRQKGWEEAERLLAVLPQVLDIYEEHTEPSQQMDASSWDRRLLPLAVYLVPFRTLRYREKNKTDKSYNAIQYVFQHGIKFKQVDVRASTLLQETVDQMAQFLRDAWNKTKKANNADSVDDTQNPPFSRPQVHVSRLEAGLLLRSCKELWPSCLLLATVLVIRKEQQLAAAASINGDGKAATTPGVHINETHNQKILQFWSMVSCAVHQNILDLGLDLCWKTKPLLDGRSLIQTLDLPKGPVVGEFLQEQIEWMLQHPEGTRDECLKHLKAVKLQRENI